MRIISGIFKGREIVGFKNPGTRPTMDRVKESLFAMIQDYLTGSTVLDLFSGSGNLALEALSQGSKKAYCNDKGQEAYRIILKNKERFRLMEQLTVLNFDFKKALFVLKEQHIMFDLIFLDPPYQTDYIQESLSLIYEYQLLTDDGIIVCESDQLEKISQDHFVSVKERKYGDKFVVILKQV